MSGAKMWPVDGSHGQSQYYQPFYSGLPPSHPHAASLPPQSVFDQQRLPPQGGGRMPSIGMELEGWLPDGSIFGMPPLPEI